MANWATLKSSIADAIKANSNQEITGVLLQNTIINIISILGENATFAGTATLATNPGIYDGPVFYLASEAGIYSNFGNIEALPGELTCMKWNNSRWEKKSCKIIGIVNDLVSGGINKALSAEMGKSLHDKLLYLQTLLSEGLQDLQTKTEDLPDIRSTIVSLSNSIQILQDDTEDLPSMRDEVERLGTEKADKSALEETNEKVAKKQERLGVGDGISLKDNIASVIIGLGLAFSGREIVVNYDPMSLTFTSDNKLSVNIGKGLHINPDNQLGVNVGDGLEISHSDKTVQLAQTVRDEIAELNRRIQALEAQI